MMPPAKPALEPGTPVIAWPTPPPVQLSAVAHVRLFAFSSPTSFSATVMTDFVPRALSARS